MVWPYLDPLTREEMVADQFLTSLDNHELHMQAATSDVRRIEDLMRIARSLEAVEGEETGRGRVRRGPNQTRFTDETDGSESEATRIADQIWAKIGSELRQSRAQNEDPLHLDPSECAVLNEQLCHPRTEMPRPRLRERRVKRKNEAGHLPPRETDHAVEMDHPSVTNVKGSAISCATVPVSMFTQWDPMDCQ